MSYSETEIKERIQELDRAIQKLQAERDALQNLMYMSVVKDRLGDVHDKRSYQRIYNEEKILQVLQSHPKGLKSREIVRRLMRLGVIVKESTLRSYLTRMAKKSDLTYDRRNQLWSLSTLRF